MATSGWPHWTEPIVFEKAVIWTMLWEVLGLGAGSLPLTLRFSPMIGGVLYWLRPGTTRLPPWPERVPGTRGTTRTVVRRRSYMGAAGGAAASCWSAGWTRPRRGSAARSRGSTRSRSARCWRVLAALGLRDKVPFLAARAEIYGNLSLIFLFPLTNLVIAAQLVFFCIWWGAASSKLNRHFPFVVTVMISNTPWNRSRATKRRLYRTTPRTCCPRGWRPAAAHLGTVIEFTLPLVLILTSGGIVQTLAVAGMVIFHAHIFSTFPLAVPLEWNIFMIFGLLFLFGHYGERAVLDARRPAAAGRSSPSPASACRCWGTSGRTWSPSYPRCATTPATGRPASGSSGATPGRRRSSTATSSRRRRPSASSWRSSTSRTLIDVLLYKGLAFRSMHSHGRALNGLTARAVEDIEDYDVREGELVAGVVLGYNFGDGHFHDQRLLAAVQERCRFAPGELRVVTLESQPAQVQRQHYRIWDAAEGLVEEGYVNVADMAKRQPWLGDGVPGRV